MTPDDLVDMELIKRVKYAYLRCLDQKDWDGLAEVLCEDATASYSGGKYTYTGRDEIVGFISRNMGREAFHSSHRVHHPEIELDGDVATATWALEDTVLDTDWNFLLTGAAFYEDVYVTRRRPVADPAHRLPTQLRVHGADHLHGGVLVTASWWAPADRAPCRST